MSKVQNKNLHSAKRAKNDEFYTQLSDIEKELKHYRRHFKGKTVFCNCDDPKTSNFWRYFILNFGFLGLKRLVATHYETHEPSYKLETMGDGIIKTSLRQNGDFRSDECVEILKECDVVVTNPPFSLFREYMAQLIEHKKKFVIIGNMNAITYKEVFKYIKDNKVWLGYGHPKQFGQPDGSMKVFGNISWFTNVKIRKRAEDIILYKMYKGNEDEYPEYDNHYAHEVGRVKNIPMDAKDKIWGVPITFLDKHNPDQFEILGIMNSGEKNPGIDKPNIPHGRPVINGKEIYFRILIKNKRL